MGLLFLLCLNFPSEQDTQQGANQSSIVASFVPHSRDYGVPRAAYDRWLTRIYLCVGLIRSDHETFNRLAIDQCIHNLGDIVDHDAPVKKVIGFD